MRCRRRYGLYSEDMTEVKNTVQTNKINGETAKILHIFLLTYVKKKKASDEKGQQNRSKFISVTSNFAFTHQLLLRPYINMLGLYIMILDSLVIFSSTT